MNRYVFIFFLISPRFVDLRKILLQTVESCSDNNNYPIKMDIKLKEMSETYYVDANVSLTIPFGNNLKYNLTLHVAQKEGGAFVKVFQLKGANPCAAANRYLGQLWYDLQRAAHIVQIGSCPVPKGRYVIQHHPLDLNRMTFQTIPTGIIKLVVTIYDVQTNSLALCFYCLSKVK